MSVTGRWYTADALDGRRGARSDGRMYLLDPLVACPSCNCHARREEQACPHCGAPLRREDGTTPRTAGALLLGLLVATAVPAMSSCSGSVESGAGGNATTSSGSTETKTTGTTGTTTTSSDGCGGGFPISADYGVPPTTTSTCDPGTGGGDGK